MAGVGGVGGPNEPQKMEAFKPGEIANMLAELRNSQVQPNSIFGGNKNVVPPNNAVYEKELAAAKEKVQEDLDSSEKRLAELEARLMEEREKREMEKMDNMELERLEAEEVQKAYEAAKAQQKEDIKKMFYD